MRNINTDNKTSKEVMEMKLMDGQLRKDPLKNRGWLRAFKKARLGWSYLSLHKDYIAMYGEPESYFLRKAEEYLTQAKQILAEEGLTDTQLERYIDQGFKWIADSCLKALRADTSKLAKAVLLEV